jgi:hypothetical protein
MKGYNKEIADELAADFEKLTGMSLSDTSRKTNSVITRCLFYKVLEKFNYMNDRLIAEWFETRGIKKNRSSIFIAMTNVDTYYKTYPLFRDSYDMYFKDKVNERLNHQKSTKKRLDEYKQLVKKMRLKEDKDPLSILIKDLPIDKRQEIYEVVSLRVKSWSWKNKDKCEIIQGGTSLEHLCY